MKICSKCGAQQADRHSRCVDCGTRLGKPLSQQELAAYEAEHQKKIGKLDDQADWADPLAVLLKDKIMAAIAAVGLVASLVCWIFRLGLVQEGYPVFLATLCFAFCIPVCLFPQFFWELEKISLSMRVYNADQMVRNGLQRTGDRVAALLMLVAGAAALLHVFWDYSALFQSWW